MFEDLTKMMVPNVSGWDLPEIFGGDGGAIPVKLFPGVSEKHVGRLAAVTHQECENSEISTHKPQVL
ncbi:hypothetical protein [Hyphomicrobium sp.]|uniref:hypothetical protein n=1 Tax=Hyphomicrobium sp. TaxID=82 RepID=UPI001E083C00|nr:hypothetical protein [Hyphomicrobium sp.]MBY0561628.1 hypothetical protein [Hyphomicrobium sp.]